ncbi:MAG: hypothetical protein ABW049_03810, partial [Spongiibacteraceae bacterium]
MIRVSGNRDNPLFLGYTCIKGRTQPTYLTHPERLLHSLKRSPYRRFEKIPIEQAMDEIASRLSTIRDVYGPRAIAGYNGTMLSAVVSTALYFYKPLFDAIGTSMLFDPNTLDKGGKQIAAALHGRWPAPSQGFDNPDTALRNCRMPACGIWSSGSTSMTSPLARCKRCLIPRNASSTVARMPM